MNALHHLIYLPLLLIICLSCHAAEDTKTSPYNGDLDFMLAPTNSSIDDYLAAVKEIMGNRAEVTTSTQDTVPPNGGPETTHIIEITNQTIQLNYQVYVGKEQILSAIQWRNSTTSDLPAKTLAAFLHAKNRTEEDYIIKKEISTLPDGSKRLTITSIDWKFDNTELMEQTLKDTLARHNLARQKSEEEDTARKNAADKMRITQEKEEQEHVAELERRRAAEKKEYVWHLLSELRDLHDAHKGKIVTCPKVLAKTMDTTLLLNQGQAVQLAWKSISKEISGSQYCAANDLLADNIFTLNNASPEFRKFVQTLYIGLQGDNHKDCALTDQEAASQYEAMDANSLYIHIDDHLLPGQESSIETLFKQAKTANSTDSASTAKPFLNNCISQKPFGKAKIAIEKLLLKYP